MTLLSIDVEASGPAPLHGDMISFAAVVIDEALDQTFESGNMRPECEHYWPAAYAAIGMTREEHLAARHSIRDRILAFADWLEGLQVRHRRYTMVSDNPGFDFQWMNFELMNHVGQQLLGHSARRIGDVWSGLRKRPDETLSWRRFRVTPHDHNPLNDAMGNAEAWLEMWRQYG
ncbi:MAG TPA: hypothetical protein VGB54_01490 [Allosphingosinicella sp.]|jgi:hypothetical protein